MSLAHLHLLLNHYPTIGFTIGLVLFLIALFSKSSDLRKMALVVFFLIAVVGIPTYLSGNAAERELCPENQCPAGVSVAEIREHEDEALLAFTFMGVTGFFAWLGLWQLRRVPALPAWNVAMVLLPAIATMGFMAAAANDGSRIRHPEIVALPAADAEAPLLADSPENAGAVVVEHIAPDAESEAAESEGAESKESESEAAAPGAAAPEAAEAAEVPKGLARSIGDLMSGASGQGWVWPASETVHFIGLSLLFTVVLLVNLRVLGVAKGVSFAAVYQLLPLGMIGFLLNLITGMLFFLGSPGQYTNNSQFHLKVVFVVLAGFNVLYFMLFDEIWKVEAGASAPLRAKFAAVSAIILWVGVLFFGHMLPFLGNSF